MPKRVLNFFGNFFQRLVDFFFRYDFFISYAQDDGKTFATALADSLTGRKFKCFIDFRDFGVGQNWRQVGQRAMKRSSFLIIVGSPKSIGSRNVRFETDFFIKEIGRQVIPIDFEGSLSGQKNKVLMKIIGPDIIRIDEKHKQLQVGPSEHVLNAIENSFSLTREYKKRFRKLAATTAILAIAAILTSWFGVQSWINEKKALKAEAEARRRLTLNSLQSGISHCEQERITTGMLHLLHGYQNTEVDDPLRRSALNLMGAWGKDMDFLLLHPESVWRVAFSPDGEFVATADVVQKNGDNNSTVRLWETATGRPLKTEIRHPDSSEILVLTFSPDSRLLLTAASDGTVRFWEPHSGKPLGPPLSHKGPILTCAFDSEGKAVVTGGGDHTARVWEVKTGKPITDNLRHDADVVLVAIHRKSQLIVTGSKVL
jgi:hypothetical protein